MRGPKSQLLNASTLLFQERNELSEGLIQKLALQRIDVGAEKGLEFVE
jgi:hypothetical protein